MWGPWFEFCDAGKVRYCSPDILILRDTLTDRGTICECKLSSTARAAKSKLIKVYRPVVEMALGGEWNIMQVSRSLRRNYRGPVVHSITEAISPSKIDFATWLLRK